MTLYEHSVLIIGSCNSARRYSLKDFLGNYLGKPVNDLLTMPGTPAQVMCAQFTAYAKQSSPGPLLEEANPQAAATMQRFKTVITRAAEAEKRERKRA